jgi:hypothetical protein
MLSSVRSHATFTLANPAASASPAWYLNWRSRDSTRKTSNWSPLSAASRGQTLQGGDGFVQPGIGRIIRAVHAASVTST